MAHRPSGHRSRDSGHAPGRWLPALRGWRASTLAAAGAGAAVVVVALALGISQAAASPACASVIMPPSAAVTGTAALTGC
jgi:hypothetical protein